MNKILILLIGVIVSVIVWAIGRHFLEYGFAQPVGSLIVVIGAGLIVSLIVWLIGKSWGLTGQIVVAIVAVAAVGFGIFHLLFSTTGPQIVTIYCSGSNEKADPNPLTVYTGETVTWQPCTSCAAIPIDINFDKGFRPFMGNNDFHLNPGSSVTTQAIIKVGYGCYSFTCRYSGGAKRIDPMIHVPG